MSEAQEAATRMDPLGYGINAMAFYPLGLSTASWLINAQNTVVPNVPLQGSSGPGRRNSAVPEENDLPNTTQYSEKRKQKLKAKSGLKQPKKKHEKQGRLHPNGERFIRIDEVQRVYRDAQRIPLRFYGKRQYRNERHSWSDLIKAEEEASARRKWKSEGKPDSEDENCQCRVTRTRTFKFQVPSRGDYSCGWNLLDSDDAADMIDHITEMQFKEPGDDICGWSD